MAKQGRPSRTRFTVQTSAPRPRSKPRAGSKGGRTPEVWVAVSVICAATFATFVALFLTSRPFDPMSASVAPQQTVPAGPNLNPSPKPSPTTTPPSPSPSSQGSPAIAGGATSIETPDDSTIQAHIESALAGDPGLSKLDVSTLVENGRVTIVGSVRSAEMKQRVEKTIRSVKGVAAIDNQLVISEATP